jgi:hypothetical protein
MATLNPAEDIFLAAERAAPQPAAHRTQLDGGPQRIEEGMALPQCGVQRESEQQERPSHRAE